MTRTLAFAALLVGLFARAASAQYQVDPQVNNRVGGELYGNNYDRDYTGQYYQTRLLPSEERYARWRSGALPSEITANRFALGRLTPHGEIDYIPYQSPLQRAMRLPVPQLYNPGYDRQSRRLVNPLPAQPGFAASNIGSGRRVTPPPPEMRQPVIPGLTPTPDRPLPQGSLVKEGTPPVESAAPFGPGQSLGEATTRPSR